MGLDSAALDQLLGPDDQPSDLGKLIEYNQNLSKQKAEAQETSASQALNDLEALANDEEESDVAPVAPYADALTQEEQKVEDEKV